MKVLRMCFSVLNEVPVPDDITDEEAEAIVEEFMEETGLDLIYNDKEWQVDNK